MPDSHNRIILIIVDRTIDTLADIAYIQSCQSNILKRGTKMNTPQIDLTVKIERKISLMQPYPRSGNFTTQTPTYDWWVSLNGRLVESFRTLKAAKLAATSYGEPNPKVTR
jgi:hypothetical protein